MVSILIVQSSGDARIQACLESIQQQVAIPYEIIVAGITPGHLNRPDGMSNRSPAIKFLHTEPHLTFAAAVNLAARHATGEYLLLLANDAVLLTGIGEAVRVLESDPAIGVVGAEMYSHQGGYLSACALFPTPMRLWSFARMWRVPVETWKQVDGVGVRRCDYVDASFLLARAEAWRSVNGMDERNSFYGDEMDLCRALLDAGHLTVQVPTIRYAHAGGYTYARMAHLCGGFRRYHRRFSGPVTRLQAEFALRAGLALRLPVYWWKSRRGGEQDRLALRYALHLYRNWNETGVEVLRAQVPAG